MNTNHNDNALENLFESNDNNKPSKKAEFLKKLYQDIYAYWLDKSYLPDKKVVQYVIDKYGRSRSQAYSDIATVKVLFGDISTARKEFQRYRVIEMILEAYGKAKKEGDIKAMIMAADKLGKYTKLDKDELEELPWDQIVPPSFEPSADPKLIGINDSPEHIEAKKEKLRKKYLGGSHIVDVEIVN